jgi:short-subunit dehydrogenase
MHIFGKTILITGASGGIGRAIAATLAEKGARLVLVARNADKLESVHQSLATPKDHCAICADLATPQGLAILKQTGQKYLQQNKRIDIVINNAGINQFRFLAQRTPESIEPEIQLNLVTPIQITQSALAWLNRPGIILNMGSTFGSIGYPGYATYCASKAGLHRFSEAMNRELDGSGIKVLYLAPRATQTDLNSEAVNQLNNKLGNHSDTAETVAKHVLNMLEKECSAKWIGWPEKLFARINQIFPTIVSSSIKKQHSVIKQFVNQINNS